MEDPVNIICDLPSGDAEICRVSRVEAMSIVLRALMVKSRLLGTMGREAQYIL